jgi:SAM-dependent methyltransferase
MRRTDETEILDDPSLPDDMVERAYRDIAAIHRWLGDTRLITKAIRRDPLPVRRILDVGCGTGLALKRIGDTLDVDIVGADIRPRPRISGRAPIVEADACLDPLPNADVAFCMCLCHHLPPEDVIRLIRNVGRYCRRFIVLDLVRHPLPLALFGMFVAPLICDVDAQDGRSSIRRSYTPAELRELTAMAIDGSAARFRFSVNPFRLRQVVDITYGPVVSDSKASNSKWEVDLTQERDRCLR